MADDTPTMTKWYPVSIFTSRLLPHIAYNKAHVQVQHSIFVCRDVAKIIWQT